MRLRNSFLLKSGEAILLIAPSETDSNILYATHFVAPDSFAYIQTSSKRYIITTDLELERAKKESSVDEVISCTDYLKKLSKKKKNASIVDAVDVYLKKFRIRKLIIPSDFPVSYYLELKRKGYLLRHKPAQTFFKERRVKSSFEIEQIRKVSEAAEKALAYAISIIKNSEVVDGFLYRSGHKITSEDIKKEISAKLLEDNCLAKHTIVACGTDTYYPHNTGSGPIMANQPIILDVFPRSETSMYYADVTRTIVKGQASEKIKEMYDVVLKGQEIGISLVRHGASCSKIHRAIKKFFDKKGFKTGLIDGKVQGFIHSTGHGVGLDVHEYPRIVSPSNTRLEEGNVVTIEPGLYYYGVGGVRIEDTVVVGKNEAINLNKFPKYLEV